MNTNFPLAHAFTLLADAETAINSARRNGTYTDRSDANLHRGQELRAEAIFAAAKVGVDEPTLFRLWNEVAA